MCLQQKGLHLTAFFLTQTLVTKPRNRRILLILLLFFFSIHPFLHFILYFLFALLSFPFVFPLGSLFNWKRCSSASLFSSLMIQIQIPIFDATFSWTYFCLHLHNLFFLYRWFCICIRIRVLLDFVLCVFFLLHSLCLLHFKNFTELQVLASRPTRIFAWIRILKRKNIPQNFFVENLNQSWCGSQSFTRKVLPGMNISFLGIFILE